MKRELIYMDAKSSKFWTIQQEGASHTVTYGRIGSAGQTSSKSFPSEEAARKDADKLVKEKLGKGYVDAASPAAAGEGDDLPMVAFTSIHRREDISHNAGTFVGKRVVDYDPEKPAKSDVVYRFRSTWDSDQLIPHLEHFLSLPTALESTAVVIGAWHGEDSGTSPEAVIATLVKGKERLPKLVALYLGDITSEENEMSWIHQADLSPLLQAFPKLQMLRSRGGEGLQLSSPSHDQLRGLALETGGMDVSVVRSVCMARFPKLEYLELWLGTEDYGANATVEDLQPLLSGDLFPHLKYLGLRNSDQADAIAAVVVNSPLLHRLETLDLSLGTLGDEGARALLKLSSPTLKRLNLHFHYIGPELVKQLKALPFTVDVSRPSDMEEDEEWRFVAVGE
jgi:predicted DNA-binding WGR domain protein